MTTRLLLLAIYLLGVAALAISPPFESFDEAQYWSAIQQTADTGHLPRYGQARVARDAQDYPGPLPASAGQPYAVWIAAPLDGPTHYAPGATLNYEAQHPPLYFLLMAPLYHAASALGWRAHFLVLRLSNWSLAFAGFCAGALSTQSILRRRGHALPVTLLPLAWPLLFPQFFEEFARITNDTLCMALIGLLWWLLPGQLTAGTARRGAAIGLVLGLGLLTKAFFLPLSLGVTLLLLVAAPRAKTLLAPALALLVGGWWYVHAWLTTGNVTGASDFVELRQHGGFLHNLAAHFPSTLDLWLRAPALYLSGLLRMLLGFCWAGSWSFVHPPRVLEAPVLLLVLLPCAFYARRVARRDFIALAPVFMVAPVLAGLLYHLAMMLAATGQGAGTPGWFFHLFSGPLSLVLTLGWARWRLMAPLLAYALALDALLAWCQIAFFSGCLPRAGQGAVHPMAASCLVNLHNLAVLGYPGIAMPCAALGASALLAVSFGIWRAR
jgi:hypothetical protein